MSEAYIGIGSNIGNRLVHLQEAVDRLSLLEDTEITTTSSVYLTEPVGDIRQNRYYNGVVRLVSTLPPEKLRYHCKRIEQELGRPDTYARWSPRVIDLDLLLINQQTIASETLTIPHPELHRRKFVLVPLLDTGNPLHPLFRIPISTLLRRCDDQSVLIKTGEKILIKKMRNT